MRPVIMVTSALVALAAVLGLWWGSQPPLDEGTAILTWAERYAVETGGQTTDCHAAPGRQEGVWIVVLCEGAAGRFAYPLDRQGQRVEIRESGT